MIQLWIAWGIGGLLYLAYGVSLDMYNYISILYDYKLDDDIENFKKEEDKKQDRIVIYSEIIEVLKTILFIFKQKEKAKLKTKSRVVQNINPDMNLQEVLDLQEKLGDDNQ